MSCCATVEAQITVHPALSFLWGKFTLFPCRSASWVSRGYLDFGVVFNFLDAWVSVTAPISPRGTLSSSGVSGPSNSEHEDLVVTSPAKREKENASWSLEDEAKLLDFLMGQRGSMTDNQMFKGPIFKEAATELNRSLVKGAAKTEAGVKAKWGRVCHPFCYCDT